MKRYLLTVRMLVLFVLFSSWGFYGHKRINRYAVFTLPPEMIGFYKNNMEYLVNASVNPDRRRFSVVDEAPRHYIDLDHYGDSVAKAMPLYWKDAVAKFSEDTLKSYGIVPWHVYRVYHQLRDAFMVRDPERILKISSELGHYIGDAHVPLHTTENYNGQLTGQDGIHGFWESRLVELYSDEYDFVIGRASYLQEPQRVIWEAVRKSFMLKDSVLMEEKKLSQKFGEKRFSFETKGKQTVKVYAADYAEAYHEILRGMVEQRMKDAIRITGSFWYTAWVDAGQPDLQTLLKYKPSEAELEARRKELREWKATVISTRPHEGLDP